MNHQQLPYRDGHLVVIYDTRIIENHYKKNSFKKKIGYFCLILNLVSLSLIAQPIIAAKNYHQSPKTTVSTAKNISENQEQSNNFDLTSWLNQRGIASIPDDNFSLIIPQININTKVIPLVDLADENATQKALKTGVVQAKGSSSPGQPGTIYIFGHSTDSPWNIKLYNAIFYPLKDIEEGSEIIIIYKGNPFIYQVEEKKIINANDLQYLANPSEKEKLILLTCWPPGTTLKRLLIVAIRT